MGERGLGIRSGAPKQGWEESEFPILCESCLGDNPYIRMLKHQLGRECKVACGEQVCMRPFTVFKWKAGTNGRFKKTEVCQTCAKLKNVCQTCLFDLQYGLPVEIRDKFLGEAKINVPVCEGNRDYWSQLATENVDFAEAAGHARAAVPRPAEPDPREDLAVGHQLRAQQAAHLHLLAERRLLARQPLPVPPRRSSRAAELAQHQRPLLRGERPGGQEDPGDHRELALHQAPRRQVGLDARRLLPGQRTAAGPEVVRAHAETSCRSTEPSTSCTS